MLGIKLLLLATEKLYIHLNARENWLWSTLITPPPFVDTQILKLNLNISVAPLIASSGDVTSDPIVKADLFLINFSNR